MWPSQPVCQVLCSSHFSRFGSNRPRARPFCSKGVRRGIRKVTTSHVAGSSAVDLPSWPTRQHSLQPSESAHQLRQVSLRLLLEPALKSGAPPSRRGSAKPNPAPAILHQAIECCCSFRRFGRHCVCRSDGRRNCSNNAGWRRFLNIRAA